MHTIDLLKGQGLPAKTTLGSVMFTAFVFVVPLLIGAGLISFYIINKTTIEMREFKVNDWEKQLVKDTPAAAEAKKLIDERNVYARRYNEVAKCVDTYLQWTPVLIALADNIPDNMVIDNLSSTSERLGTSRRNVDPNKPLEIAIPQRAMVMDLSGRGEGTFHTIAQEYQKTLESDNVVPYLEKIGFSMRRNSTDASGEAFTLNFSFKKTKE